jgi:type IV pilus assembly protein PilB
MGSGYPSRARKTERIRADAKRAEAKNASPQGNGMEATRLRIGEIFIREKLVTAQQLDEIEEIQRQLQRQGGARATIGELLVQRGLITPRDRDRCLAMYLDYPYIDVGEITPDREALDLLQSDFAKKHKVLPIHRENGSLSLVTTVPPNIHVLDEIRALSGAKELKVQVGAEEDILQSIDQHYRTNEQIKDQMVGIMQTLSASGQVVFKEERVESEDLAVDTAESEVIRIANLIITIGLEQKASDIHIQPAKDKVRVRYRVDGILRDEFSVPNALKGAVLSRIKIMARMDIANRRSAQDGRITAHFDGLDYDFRVASLPSVYGEKVVIRILDKSSLTLGLGNLGFLPDNLRRLRDMFTRPYGILLVTGPTGSGKSTTLYSVLNEINTEDVNIITVEDPVEYNLDGITQVQVNNAAGLTFAAALRNILRQDPDIIMLGEIRDQETATIACEAALTGHLVLATLHTNNAASAPTRLVDLEVEPVMISTALIGVLAQRLVRRLCPFCKEEYELSKDVMEKFNFHSEEGRSVRLYRPSSKGCHRCKMGYKGRTGVHELLTVDEDIRHLILKRSGSFDIMQTAVRTDMSTLSDDVRAKMLMGLTSLEEAIRVIYVD